MAGITPTTPEYALTSKDPGLLPPHLKAIRHIIDFLKWRFSKLPTGSYHWAPETEDVPDQKDSEIFIGADTPIKTQVVGKRPAIAVSRSQMAFQGIGLGDLAFHDLRTGAKAYQDMLPTTLVLSVLSRTPFVADRLAWFCTEQLWTLREEVIKTEPCILLVGTKPVMGPPSPAGQLVDTTEESWSVVMVTMPMYLQHTSSKMPLGKTIWNRTYWQLNAR